ncbi:unnamed protein product, partial [Effrenium voratum]
VSAVQGALRENGQGLFDFLAKKDIVKQILKERRAADVVFDTLSYSAGPLPEQLLADPRMTSFPVWVCLGDKDPWTPAKRVRALDRFLPVRRIDLLPGGVVGQLFSTLVETGLQPPLYVWVCFLAQASGIVHMMKHQMW